MYRLLVVDDEPIITDSLCEMFTDMKEPEFDVCKAYCGGEALNALRRTPIDIVLTDICMPDMTGIEVHNEICRNWPGCKVIFLTGFSDFEFIRSAVRNNSVDYILKTENDEAILQAVMKAIGQIEEERSKELLLEKARVSIEKATPILQERYLLDLVNGLEDTPFNKRTQFSELNIPLNPEMPVMLMLGKIDHWPDTLDIAGRMKAVYGMKDIADRNFTSKIHSVAVVYDRSRVIWMIQPRAGCASGPATPAWEGFTLYIQEAMDALQHAYRELYKIPVSFVSTEEPVEWTDIPGRLDLLKHSLDKASGISGEILLIGETGSTAEAGAEEAWKLEGEARARAGLKRVNDLEDLLEGGHREEFMLQFDRLMASAYDKNFLSSFLNREIFFRVSSLFMAHINRWKLYDKLTPHISLDRMLDMRNFSDWDEIKAYFVSLAGCIFKQKDSDSLSNMNRIFVFIKDYTERNLDGDLSLTRFAELLHFHPFYLSRLFKQVTGKSFSEYIGELKFQKASELLKQSELKVNEIAELLGFETASYFTRFFKKYSSLSPQEYRSSFVE